jgi:subtilisin family serine protease
MRIYRFLALSLVGLLLTLSQSLSPFRFSAIAQTTSSSPPPGLYYLYQGQPIPLEIRQDAIAVESQATERSGEPLYRSLRQQLQPDGATRGDGSTNPPGIEINQLNDTTALINLSSRAPQAEAVRRELQQNADNTVLPVLSRVDGQDTLVLPNEIIVSFDPSWSEAQVQAALEQQNLELIRPLRFTTRRYLVRSRSATGVEVLNVANQLNQVTGIQSATPNFLQTTTFDVGQPAKSLMLQREARPDTPILRSQALPKSLQTDLQTDMMPLLWNLNSTSMRQCQAAETLNRSCLNAPPNRANVSRTDVRSPEAWQQSRQGEGIVVAVIDSTIQWDHPNLANNLASITRPDRLPNENRGWDFAEDDPDTRVNQGELNLLKEALQDTFRLSDAELVQKYSATADRLGNKPECQRDNIADCIRSTLQLGISDNFHGTSVASVIAAQPFSIAGQSTGVVGVAPKAKILPIRVGTVSIAGPTLSDAAIIEAIGYAADRGADVINLSLGRASPNPELAARIAEVLDNSPRLIIVAAAGNCGDSSRADCTQPNRVAYPAGDPEVLAVGATTLSGTRASYSQYGERLDVVAPGGGDDLRVLTTGGTFDNRFWQGMGLPDRPWGNSYDARGAWVWQNGTSFASPAVAGVVALMLGEDPQNQLDRTQIVQLLKQTAQTRSLILTDAEQELYQRDRQTAGSIPSGLSATQYFFGAGLVDAEAAVKAVQSQVR